ncbi:MAG: hypothetical protein M1827_002327 [Pycnora praestabilis]|nr:MAG: hypothetical protein M1827_002327 [Pycnora praestabilis]
MNTAPPSPPSRPLSPLRDLLPPRTATQVDDQVRSDAAPIPHEIALDADLEADGDKDLNDMSMALMPKKKKKKSRGGKKKPTGFEEYYVDAPITPAEYEEENDMYDSRIETCIQRYKAKRKFDNERSNVFDKYMALGGINTGPKTFSGGLNAKCLSEHDAQQIATMSATEYVGGDKHNVGKEGSTWVVDFEAVAKGFFSSSVPMHFDLVSEKQVKAHTAVIRNFLNYILYHSVCPEYEQQVKAAKVICDLADKELVAAKVVSAGLPGDYNIACSTLYGGYYLGLYCEDQEWAQGTIVTVGMSDMVAKQVVMAGLAAHGTDEQCERVAASHGHPKAISRVAMGFEITEIVHADEDAREFYDKQIGGRLRTTGIMRAKNWHNPELPPEDLTDDEEDSIFETAALSNGEHYEFWVDEDILDYCFTGMKVEATVHKLDTGVQYFDTVTSVRCSFFTFLDNERMMGWKHPVLIKDSKDIARMRADESEAP